MFPNLQQRPPSTNEFMRTIEGQVAVIESDNRQTLRDWQAKSLEERGEGIIACCRSAAAIMKARQNAGLEPVPRRPWPKHIWDMLRTHAAEARNASHDAT